MIFSCLIAAELPINQSLPAKGDLDKGNTPL